MTSQSKTQATVQPPVKLNFWIALIGLGDDTRMAKAAANVAGRLLEGYLKKSGAQAKFSGTEPSTAKLKDGDLLLHLCLGSLIDGIAANLDLETDRASEGSGGGATAEMDGSGMLSEVYWRVVRGRGKNDDAGRGKVLANLAFHEFVHNKCDGARINGARIDPHTEGGGIVLLPGLTTGAMRGKPSDDNFAFMKRFIHLPVKQYPYCLKSELLGF